MSLILGVDVSHWDAQVNYPSLAKANCAFVGIKCAEHGVADPMFRANVLGATAAGLPHWGYAFIHDSDTPDMIKATFDILQDVPFAIDWEAADASAASVGPWCDAYTKQYNRVGLGYYGISPTGLKEGETIPDVLKTWPRWFAEYNSFSRIPMCTSLDVDDWRTEYLIWQYSEYGAINGINGHVDMNHLSSACSIDQLKTFLATGHF